MAVSGAGVTGAQSQVDGRNLRSDETRAALLVAGRHVLARSGPDGLTVTAVAREAQVSRATFYNHFPSLDAFIIAGAKIAMDRVYVRTLNSIPDDHRPDFVFGVGFTVWSIIAEVRRDPRLALFIARLTEGIHEEVALGHVDERIDRAMVAMDVGQLSEQDAALLEATTRRMIYAAVERFCSTGFTPTAERDTARIVIQAIGINEHETTAVLDRIEPYFEPPPG